MIVAKSKILLQIQNIGNPFSDQKYVTFVLHLPDFFSEFLEKSHFHLRCALNRKTETHTLNRLSFIGSNEQTKKFVVKKL